MPLARIRQDPSVSDWTEAILSIEPWFGDATIIILPDMIYQVGPWVADPIADLADAAQRASFSFLAARKSPESLAHLGALHVAAVRGQDGVLAFEDKPEDARMYNAAWAAFGFSGDQGVAGMRIIDASTRRISPGRIDAPPIHGAPIVWIDSFEDCGVWQRYLTHLAADGYEPHGYSGAREGRRSA
jgi:hypothetical protein